jgi:hypothetical protein
MVAMGLFLIFQVQMLHTAQAVGVEVTHGLAVLLVVRTLATVEMVLGHQMVTAVTTAVQEL